MKAEYNKMGREALSAPLPTCEYGYGSTTARNLNCPSLTVFTTALFPKNDTYYLPLKDAVRRKAEVTAGDVITIAMKVAAASR